MGEIYGQLEYTSYGELGVEHVPVEATPFRFTGKERDSETGLYYFGVRYLNPQTSMWLSADPAMGEYIPQAPINDDIRKQNQNLPGMGGVFNYVNLYAYHYAGNNPVKLTDPDGRSAYSRTGEDIFVITEHGDMVLVHDGEMFEGRIDGVRFNDGTVAKVTDNDKVPLSVDIVLYKEDGEYGARFFGWRDKHQNNLGDWWKKTKDPSADLSGLYVHDQVTDTVNYNFSGEWRQEVSNAKRDDPRVRPITPEEVKNIELTDYKSLELEKRF